MRRSNSGRKCRIKPWIGQAAASPSALASDRDGGAEEVYSEEDLANITERLSDLAYLE